MRRLTAALLLLVSGCAGLPPSYLRPRFAQTRRHASEATGAALARSLLPVTGGVPSTNGGPMAAVVRKKAMNKAPAVGVADMLRIAPQSPFSCRGPYIVTNKDDNSPFAQIRLISNISNDISVSWEVRALAARIV